MLDSDLADLYGVETKQLVRAVKRQTKRFPEDFMFQLSEQEVAGLRCQIGTSKGRGGRRDNPYAFTEQGVAMLSSVLNSERAVEVNIEIMRAFVRLRKLMASQEDLWRKITPRSAHLARHLGRVVESTSAEVESELCLWRGSGRGRLWCFGGESNAREVAARLDGLGHEGDELQTAAARAAR